MVNDNSIYEDGTVTMDEEKNVKSDCHSSGSELNTTRCKYCTKTLLECEMRIHVDEEHSSNVFVCNLCNVSFDEHTRVLKHFSFFHEKSPSQGDINFPKKLVRMECKSGKCATDRSKGSFLSASLQVAQDHLAECHPDEEQLHAMDMFCRICDFDDTLKNVLGSAEDVEEHMTTHHPNI